MRSLRTFGLGAALLLLATAGCGGEGGDGSAKPETGPAPATGGSSPGAGAGAQASDAAKPSGDVLVDGSSTVFRISKAAQEAYNKVNDEARVVVNNHGTGGGFGRYLEGEVDIVDASRTAKPEEESKAKEKGLDWTRFLVGYDGITLVKNPENDFVNALTVDQLKKIWEPGSKVKTWKDVDSSWPDRKVVLYSPDHDSGTFEFFTEKVVGKAKKQRDDVQASADDNTLVSGVAGDKDGLGYFGYAYFAANKDKLRAIPVQKGDGKPVLPSPETILDQSYAPLSRPLFLYVKNSSFRQKPVVAAFLRYYLENVEKLSVKAGYVAPTADDVKANSKALEEMAPKATASK